MALGLASIFALGACGGDADKANKIVDELCACKDMKCLTTVQEKMASSDLKITEAEGEKIVKKIENCTATIMKNVIGGAAEAAGATPEAAAEAAAKATKAAAEANKTE